MQGHKWCSAIYECPDQQRGTRHVRRLQQRGEALGELSLPAERALMYVQYCNISIYYYEDINRLVHYYINI